MAAWFSLLQKSAVLPAASLYLLIPPSVAGLAPNHLQRHGHHHAGARGPESRGRRASDSHRPADAPGHSQPAVTPFNWQTGIGAPNPSQTFTISTTGPSSVSYSFTHDGDTGNWISTISPPSGTNPPEHSDHLTVNPNGLALGTYNGKLTLFTPGGTPTQQDIRITLDCRQHTVAQRAQCHAEFHLSAGHAASPRADRQHHLHRGTLASYAGHSERQLAVALRAQCG